MFYRRNNIYQCFFNKLPNNHFLFSISGVFRHRGYQKFRHRGYQRKSYFQLFNLRCSVKNKNIRPIEQLLYRQAIKVHFPAHISCIELPEINWYFKKKEGISRCFWKTILNGIEYSNFSRNPYYFVEKCGEMANCLFICHNKTYYQHIFLLSPLFNPKHVARA